MDTRAECDRQEKVIAELKQKKSELEDDRRFLDFEIRDCRQQNQSLKVAISKTHNKCDDLNATKEELVHKYASELSQTVRTDDFEGGETPYQEATVVKQKPTTDVS